MLSAPCLLRFDNVVISDRARLHVSGLEAVDKDKDDDLGTNASGGDGGATGFPDFRETLSSGLQAVSCRKMTPQNGPPRRLSR